MNNLINSVKEIVQRITETETKRKKLADFVRELPPEMKIMKKVNPLPLDNVTIAGIDGGLVKKSLHGMDCMLVRAVGAGFRYSGGKVEKVEYFPSKNPAPRPEIYESPSEIEWNHFTAINRLIEEITTATNCIEKLKPDILLLDGMLLPHHLDKPAATSPLNTLYKKLIQEYKNLFEKAISSRVALAGVIEDSRNIIFCDHLSNEVLSQVNHGMVPELKKLLKKTRDSNLLHLVLERGERTTTFPSSNPLSSDFGIPPIRSFYLKTASYDRPLKIDFLPQTVDIDTLAGLLLSVSGQHSGYGLPVPLIEADNVAHLSEIDMENFYSSILSLTGNITSTMKLRREQRPFS